MVQKTLPTVPPEVFFLLNLLTMNYGGMNLCGSLSPSYWPSQSGLERVVMPEEERDISLHTVAV